MFWSASTKLLLFYSPINTEHPPFSPPSQPSKIKPKMCKETSTTFTGCPCNMKRLTECKDFLRREARHLRHHEDDELTERLDYRECKTFDVKEASESGCCEMAQGKRCPYLIPRCPHNVRTKGGGKGPWDANDFEMPWKAVLAAEREEHEALEMKNGSDQQEY
jgi:hypothetical protein